MDTRTFFLARVDAYLATAGMTERQLGQQAVGNPKILQRVRRGTHVTTDTIERIERFMAGTQTRAHRNAGRVESPAPARAAGAAGFLLATAATAPLADGGA